MNDITISADEAKALLENIHQFTAEEQEQILTMLGELEARKQSSLRRNNLLEFAKAIQPDYKVGLHHKKLAELLEDMAFGRKDRVTVSIAPRMGKSLLTSTIFPAWFIGNFPNKKIMLVSHTADLAVDFGRKVRNIVATETYSTIFPEVKLSTDSKSAGRWSTNQGGEFFAVGIGGAIAGRGADFLCVRHDTKVFTARGRIPADAVQKGDLLLGHKGFGEVEKVFTRNSNHFVDVDGVVMTPNHPVWVHTKGWIPAEKLTTRQLVDTISLWVYSHYLLRRLYGRTQNARQKLHSYLQYLGDDAAASEQSERGELHAVWRAGNKVLRAVVGVSELFGRHGHTHVNSAHVGQNRHKRGLHPGELSLGRPGDSSMQPSQWGEDNSVWGDVITVPVGAQNWPVPGSNKAPHIGNGDGSRRSIESREDELGAAPRSTKEFGWVRRTAVRVISSCRKRYGHSEGVLVGSAEKVFSSRIFGLLVGVRSVREVNPIWGSSTQTVNFQVAETNTFYAGELMTHNCIDDPHNEQEILNGNLEVFSKAYEWYAYGARTRLMPGGRVAVIATRWAETDLIGQLHKDMVRNPTSDQWEVVEFPALFPVDHVSEDAPEAKKWKSLWPEQWPVETLLKTKASMPPFQWAAQYLQQPTNREAAIIKREWWQQWEDDDPPQCEFLIMTLDAAAEKNNRADFTGITVWGVFNFEGEDGMSRAGIILLNSIKQRMEFPELKQVALQEYNEWKPDFFVVEKKSSGTPLYQELRRIGILVSEFTPHRGTGDKFVRLNSVADIFSSGLVWYPAGRRWAEEVVDEVCGFPNMANDDLVDCSIMALMRFRDGGFIKLPSDWDDDEYFEPVKAAYY